MRPSLATVCTRRVSDELRRCAASHRRGEDGRMPIAAFKDICMDATDALAQARFWSAALGAPLVDLGDGSARLDPPPGGSPAETLWIDPVPEPRTVKTGSTSTCARTRNR